jgi:hypothetical protein
VLVLSSLALYRVGCSPRLHSIVLVHATLQCNLLLVFCLLYYSHSYMSARHYTHSNANSADPQTTLLSSLYCAAFSPLNYHGTKSFFTVVTQLVKKFLRLL